MTTLDDDARQFPPYELDGTSGGGVVTPDAAKIPPVDTRFSNIEDEHEGFTVPQVTPNEDTVPSSSSFKGVGDEHGGGGTCETTNDFKASFVEAILKTVTWRKNMKKKERSHPHPFKMHCLGGGYNEQSLKEMICAAFPNLKDLCNIKEIRNYPLCMRLFLCALAFLLSGLPSEYAIDPWDLIAKTWCNNCSTEEMKGACTHAIQEFLCLQSEENPSMLEFIQQYKMSSNWTPESTTEKQVADPLPKYLENAHTKKNPFFKDIFGQKQKVTEWNIDTRMFLFAIDVLAARSANRNLVIETVAGFTKKQLKVLKPDALLEAISSEEILRCKEQEDLAQILERLHAIPKKERNSSINNLLDQITSDTLDESKDEYIPKLVEGQLAMPKKERSSSINNLLHQVTSHILDESKISKHMSKVSYKSKKNRPIEKVYTFLPQPTKAFLELSQSAKKKKANIVQAIMDQLLGSDNIEQQKELVLLLMKNTQGLVLLREEDFKWTDAQLALILSVVGSANKMVTLDRYERAFKKNSRFPAQLKKKLPKLGSMASLSIESQMIPLEMNASKEVKAQLSWRLKTPSRALERLLEASFLSGKFTPSEKFSSKENKLVYAFGADKDTMATSMLLRLVNRQGGNCSDFVATLAMFEKAAENYENMAKTILLEGSGVHTLLQLVLDNKLFVIIINSIDKEGNIVESQCIALNLFADHRQEETDERMLTEFDVRLERCGAALVPKEDFNVVTSPKDFENSNFENVDNETITLPSDDEAEEEESSVDKEDDSCNDDEQSTSTATTAYEDANDVTTDSFAEDEAEADASSVGEEDDNSNDDDQSASTATTTYVYSDENDVTTDSFDDEEAPEEASSIGMECIALKLDEGWKNGSKCLWLQLIFESDSYYGYRIFLNNPDKDNDGQDKLLVAGLFEKPIQFGLEDRGIDCALRQVIGFVSCDKKNSWATMGMMESSSASKNCIHCTQSKKDYKKNFPDWTVAQSNRIGDKNALLQYKVAKMLKDCPSRCGKNSNPILHRKLQAATNDGNHTYSAAALRAIREEYGCVVNKPLLDIHPSKQTFGALHNGAGLENHFKDNMDSKMEKIDEIKIPGAKTWLEKVEEADKLCHLIKTTNKARLKKLKEESKAIEKNIASYKLSIQKSEDPTRRSPSMTDEAVQSMRETLETLLVEKKRIDMEFGNASRSKNGAEALQKSIKAYLSSKKPKGPAQWAFRKAIELAGPRFNPQFGGMDLSHAHGLLMLEKWTKIIGMVRSAYPSDSAKREMVGQEMDGSKKIADPLFAMNKLLKSQEKWDDEKIEDLKDYCYQVLFKWLEFFDQGVFPKLHDVAWHIPEFIIQHGMYGILSEESFESRHIVHKQLAWILKSMPNIKLRNEVFTFRLQFFQLPEFEKAKAELAAATTKKKRGPYNTTPKDNSISFEQSEVIMDGDNISIDKNMSIHPELREVYNMCTCGIVPVSWYEIFCGRDDIDENQKLWCRYSSQI